MMRYEAGRAPVSERHVQAIWYDEALRPRSIRTVRGCEVRVLDPGAWNLGAGPDFLHAVLEAGRDRRRITGDVEVHLKPSGWTTHGHGSDAAYGNVAVHVTWFRGDPPADLPAGCLSICLGEFLRTRTDFSPDEIDLAAYPYGRPPVADRPCFRLLGRDPDRGRAVLIAAGRHRLRIKARRIRTRLLRAGDPDQVVYEEVMSALGGGRNSRSYRELAARLPFCDLPDREEAAREVLNSVAWLEIDRVVPWRRDGVRPCNSPDVRLADAAAIFTGGKPRHAGSRLLAVLLANVAVPFALARDVLEEPPEWLPPEEVNSIMRLAAFRLFGRDHNPALYSGNGVMLQGLMQINSDCCIGAHDVCRSCGLVESLSRSGGNGEGVFE